MWSTPVIGMGQYDHIPADIQRIAQSIRLLVLDVDGVMTDASLHYTHDGTVTKVFSAQDGLGMRALVETGVEIIAISGATSRAVATRLRTLRILEHYRGEKDKRKALQTILQHKTYTVENVAYMGDDWIDIAIMSYVALPIAVHNAQPEVKDVAKLITQNSGGRGAIREVVRFIMYAQNTLATALQRFL